VDNFFYCAVQLDNQPTKTLTLLFIGASAPASASKAHVAGADWRSGNVSVEKFVDGEEPSDRRFGETEALRAGVGTKKSPAQGGAKWLIW